MTAQEKRDADIARNEYLMRRLREICRGTSLMENSWFEDFRQMSSTYLKDLRLQGEGEFGWQEYHWSYYAHEDVRARDWRGNMMYVRHEDPEAEALKQPFGYVYNEVPQWLRWHTTDRLAFLAVLPLLAEAWAGLPIDVQFDGGWDWVRGERSARPNGKAQHVPHYGFIVFFGDARKALVAEQVTQIAQRICRSADSRADRSLFELFEDQLDAPSGCGTYGWVPDGAHLWVHGKANVERLQQTLFSDCECTVTKQGRGGDVVWQLHVVFPDCKAPPRTEAELVQELREESGAPLMACKKAVRFAKGDYAQALTYLQSGEWKQGLLIN